MLLLGQGCSAYATIIENNPKRYETTEKRSEILKKTFFIHPKSTSRSMDHHANKWLKITQAKLSQKHQRNLTKSLVFRLSNLGFYFWTRLAYAKCFVSKYPKSIQKSFKSHKVNQNYLKNYLNISPKTLQNFVLLDSSICICKNHRKNIPTFSYFKIAFHFWTRPIWYLKNR